MVGLKSALSTIGQFAQKETSKWYLHQQMLIEGLYNSKNTDLEELHIQIYIATL